MTTLFEASRTLRDAAKHNFKTLPGGSVSGYLNTLPSDVRLALATQYKGLEHAVESGGRLAPFQPKMTEEELTAGQPKELRDTISKLTTEQITNDLTQRMGTPVPTADTSPPDRREILSAAFDAHIQE
jgi:hypothetical protein